MIYLHEIIKSRLKREKVAIGLVRYDETSEDRIYRAAEIADEFAKVLIVDEEQDTAKRLIELAESEKVYSAVRGTASAKKILGFMRERYRPLRVAVLETPAKKLFLLSPVGVDEGSKISEKIELAKCSARVAKSLGLGTEIAFLSGGRYEDTGRSDLVDRTLADAEFCSKITGGVNYEIRLEDAIEKDIIIAPDGISGNLIFRSLCYLGKGMEYGAVFCNVPFRVIDTSRSQSAEGFARAIALSVVI